jgi:hypothetical protein
LLSFFVPFIFPFFPSFLPNSDSFNLTQSNKLLFFHSGSTV